MALVLSQNWQLAIEGALVFVIGTVVYYLTLLINNDALISVVATFTFLGIYVVGTTINLSAIFKKEGKTLGDKLEEVENAVLLIDKESSTPTAVRESLFVLPDTIKRTVKDNDLLNDGLDSDEITIDHLAAALEEELALAEEEENGDGYKEAFNLPNLTDIKGVFKRRCPFCKREIRIDVGEKQERLTLIPGNGLVEPTMKIDLSHTINQERHELEVQVSVWTLEYRTTLHRKKKTIINVEQASVTS